MPSTFTKTVKFLFYRVNWGAVCYFFAFVFGIISIFAFDVTSDNWWAYFLGYAITAVVFVAIGTRESARYFCRVQKRRENEFEKLQRRCKLRNDAKRALKEHEEMMRSRSTASQI